MADLLRYAMEKVFEDQLDVIAIKRGLEEHAKDPSGTISIEELHGADVAYRVTASPSSEARSAHLDALPVEYRGHGSDAPSTRSRRRTKAAAPRRS